MPTETLTTTVTLARRLATNDSNLQLYILLVSSVSLGPLECLQILGFWLWLEYRGCELTIQTILSLPTPIIEKLAGEAMSCLRCIKDLPTTSEAFTIPFTKRLLASHLSQQILHKYRYVILPELQILVGELCSIVFSDEGQQVLSHGGNREGLGQTRMSSRTSNISSSYVTPMEISSFPLANSLNHHNSLMRSEMAPNRAARGPSSNHNGLQIYPRRSMMHHNSCAHAFSQLNMRTNERVTSIDNRARETERTMFLTFSRGYPVTEEEIRTNLTAHLGNSIEAIHMQEVGPGEQALYARVVFLRPAFVVALLDGEEKAKYTINGKHVWMRRYVDRRRMRM